MAAAEAAEVGAPIRPAAANPVLLQIKPHTNGHAQARILQCNAASQNAAQGQTCAIVYHKGVLRQAANLRIMMTAVQAGLLAHTPISPPAATLVIRAVGRIVIILKFSAALRTSLLA